MPNILSLPDAARLALQCLDLTSLNNGDTRADIVTLCQRAQTPFGPVAAVCVWPRFVSQARDALPAAIKVAAVANFPAGSLDFAQALSDVRSIVSAGGDEVDLVLPYRALMQGQSIPCADFLGQMRSACGPLLLKVIIESGELATAELIAQATRLALDAGADFVKTSTGKTKVSATLAAARVMLQEIAAHGTASAGFKASGGIRTVQETIAYLELVAEILGANALNAQHLRFGASGLLCDIETLLAGKPSIVSIGAY